MAEALTIICGPTASGKTALAIRLAKEIGAEIVSADSQQVYRYFNIGTAKPSDAELAQVPHHLISIVEPTDTFSAVHFQKMADAAIADIVRRGSRVVVVGGTGLYVRVLLHGVVAAPAADPELRARLTAEAEQIGRQALHARLAQVDPVTAATVNPTDLVRIIRALEIHAMSGETASSHRSQHAFATDRYQYRLFVLAPNRDELYERINLRAQAMFEAGLVKEVESLVQRGFRDAPPMRSVGYAQALAVFEGRMTREDAIRDTAQKTRHYAKRQMTWFRKERGAQLVLPPYDAVFSLSEI